LHLQFKLNNFYQVSSIYADTLNRPVDIKDLYDNGFITDLIVDSIDNNTGSTTAIYNFVSTSGGPTYQYAATSFSATYPNAMHAYVRANNSALP
jgi:hypothetical protein